MQIKIHKSGVSGVVISITGTADGAGVIVIGPIVLAGGTEASASDGKGGGGNVTTGTDGST